MSKFVHASLSTYIHVNVGMCVYTYVFVRMCACICVCLNALEAIFISRSMFRENIILQIQKITRNVFWNTVCLLLYIKITDSHPVYALLISGTIWSFSRSCVAFDSVSRRECDIRGSPCLCVWVCVCICVCVFVYSLFVFCVCLCVCVCVFQCVGACECGWW